MTCKVRNIDDQANVAHPPKIVSDLIIYTSIMTFSEFGTGCKERDYIFRTPLALDYRIFVFISVFGTEKQFRSTAQRIRKIRAIPSYCSGSLCLSAD